MTEETKSPNPLLPNALVKISRQQMWADGLPSFSELRKLPEFKKGVDNLPTAELKSLLAATSKISTVKQPLDPATFVQQLVYLRWTNPICFKCKNNKCDTFYRCGKCHLVYWCSDKCHQQDQAAHSNSCCNKDASVPSGPGFGFKLMKIS
jgi:hypothetical protein